MPRLKITLILLGGWLWLAGDGAAQSTVDPTQNRAWAANLGWTQWRPSAAAGAVIGEYVCSGCVYAANVGWMNLGSGSPANGIQYQNNSATDWGVNYLATLAPGVGSLRGMAYAANIGWVSFEAVGNPSVNLLNGQLFGYAYSANCGWINLGNSTVYVVKTDFIQPGVDSDGDGIADAFERLNFGNLTAAGAATDYDGDGLTDAQEYLDATSPTTPNGPLRITAFTKAASTVSLTFNSTPARVYRIEQSSSLTPASWADAGLGAFAPDGSSTARSLFGVTGAARFYRVRALRLGP